MLSIISGNDYFKRNNASLALEPEPTMMTMMTMMDYGARYIVGYCLIRQVQRSRVIRMTGIVNKRSF